MPSDTQHLNDLLRGRELSLNLPTPIGDLPEISGRADALIALWRTATPSERQEIELACAQSDRAAAQIFADLSNSRILSEGAEEA